jgi:hypothetical protein
MQRWMSQGQISHHRIMSLISDFCIKPVHQGWVVSTTTLVNSKNGFIIENEKIISLNG